MRHFRRDLTYSDERRFRIPSAGGLKSDCTLILRYLSNSHVADFKARPDEGLFNAKMLAALVKRNFSMGRLRMSILDAPLTDYRPLDAVFSSGMRLDALNLFIHEDTLHGLVETNDFFRLPVVQQLKDFWLIFVRFHFCSSVVFSGGKESVLERMCIFKLKLCGSLMWARYAILLLF